VLLNAAYMTIFCARICWYWTRIVVVIWGCNRGPLFWDTVVCCKACCNCTYCMNCTVAYVL